MSYVYPNIIAKLMNKQSIVFRIIPNVLPSVNI